MYRGPYCYRCRAKVGDAYTNPVVLSHNDSDHVESTDPVWIEAKDIQGGERALVIRRGTQQYNRIIHGARAIAEKPGYVWFMDASHSSYTVPADKLMSVYTLSDEFKENNG